MFIGIVQDACLPQNPNTCTGVEQLFHKETDSKVRKFAARILADEIRRRNRQEMARLHMVSRPMLQQRGKCDFCSERNVFVERDFDTMIPSAKSLRSALICDRCVDHS